MEGNNNNNNTDTTSPNAMASMRISGDEIAVRSANLEHLNLSSSSRGSKMVVHKKVVVTGDMEGEGYENTNSKWMKTVLLLTYSSGAYPSQYIKKTTDLRARVELEEIIIEYGLCDTTGEEDYDGLRSLTYAQADLVLFVFSAVVPETFAHIRQLWGPEVERRLQGVPTILVGCEIDLINKSVPHVSREEAITLASDLHCLEYFECSTRRNIGVIEIFRRAAEHLSAPHVKSKGGVMKVLSISQKFGMMTLRRDKGGEKKDKDKQAGGPSPAVGEGTGSGIGDSGSGSTGGGGGRKNKKKEKDPKGSLKGKSPRRKITAPTSTSDKPQLREFAKSDDNMRVGARQTMTMREKVKKDIDTFNEQQKRKKLVLADIEKRGKIEDQPVVDGFLSATGTLVPTQQQIGNEEEEPEGVEEEYGQQTGEGGGGEVQHIDTVTLAQTDDAAPPPNSPKNTQAVGVERGLSPQHHHHPPLDNSGGNTVKQRASSICGSSSGTVKTTIPPPSKVRSSSVSVTTTSTTSTTAAFTPLKVEQWSKQDVCDWLVGLNWDLDTSIDDYLNIIKTNDIDGQVLLSLSSDDLGSLGIKSFGHKRKILLEIDKLKAT